MFSRLVWGGVLNPVQRPGGSRSKSQPRTGHTGAGTHTRQTQEPHKPTSSKPTPLTDSPYRGEPGHTRDTQAHARGHTDSYRYRYSHAAPVPRGPRGEALPGLGQHGP